MPVMAVSAVVSATVVSAVSGVSVPQAQRLISINAHIISAKIFVFILKTSFRKICTKIINKKRLPKGKRKLKRKVKRE
jgi:hypothetical protein